MKPSVLFQFWNFCHRTLLISHVSKYNVKFICDVRLRSLNSSAILAKVKKVKSITKGKDNSSSWPSSLSTISSHEEMQIKYDNILSTFCNILTQRLSTQLNVASLQDINIRTADGDQPLSHISELIQKNSSTIFVDMSLHPEYFSVVRDTLRNSSLPVREQQEQDLIVLNIAQMTRERREALLREAKQQLTKSKSEMNNLYKSLNRNLIKGATTASIGEDDLRIAQQYLTDQVKLWHAKAESVFKAKEKELLV